MASVIRNLYNNYIKVPSYITERKDTIHSGLSLITLIALSGVAYAEKKRDFAIAFGVGAVWQLTLTILKVDRFEKPQKKTYEKVDQHNPVQSKQTAVSLVLGCVDGYSRWFIGAPALAIEKIMGGAALAFEHLHIHNLKNNPYIQPLRQNVTFGNFLGVCMGIRFMLAVESIFAKKEKRAPLRPDSDYTSSLLLAQDQKEDEVSGEVPAEIEGEAPEGELGEDCREEGCCDEAHGHAHAPTVSYVDMAYDSTSSLYSAKDSSKKDKGGVQVKDLPGRLLD